MFHEAVNRPCGRLLLGMSGGIFTTQMFAVVSELRRTFASEIRVVMTESSTRMLPPRTLDLLTDGHTYVDMWGDGRELAPHIRLARWAELFLVMPASANTLGKIANGICDNLLTTTAVAIECPTVLAPAMNPSMWASSAVKRNVQSLRSDGFIVIEPEEHLSVTTGVDGDVGMGLTLDKVTPVLMHEYMKSRRAATWDSAVAVAPLTPADEGGPKRHLPIVGATNG